MKFRLETMVNTYNVRSKANYRKRGQNLAFIQPNQQLTFQQLIEGKCND